MPNRSYNPTGNPTFRASGSSPIIRSEFTNIGVGFTEVEGELDINAAAVAARVPLTYLDTDATLAADSDSKIASQKATKAFVNNAAFSGAGLTPASQAEAETGTDNTKWMSPLRVAQEVAVLVPVASQLEAEAGAINTKYMTPLRVKQEIAVIDLGLNILYINAGLI